MPVHTDIRLSKRGQASPAMSSTHNERFTRNTLDRDLAANCPDATHNSWGWKHSHDTDRANSTGGAVAWFQKLQSNMVWDAYLLWGKKVLIREI